MIGVRRNGVVDAREVQSDSDTFDALMERLEEGRNSLPVNRQGKIDVIALKCRSVYASYIF